MQNFVSIVTLSAEDNAKSSKLLGEGFKRPIYWNKYKVIDNRAVEIADADEKKIHKRIAWLKLSRSQKILCSCL